ncbi:MAG: hypothetical protein PUC65_10825 [Clostridiales bacterium]|nr:hypothetical protein [Clostridiales bacterium]
MSSINNITLEHITLLNDSNQLIITIPLDHLWDSIIDYEFAYINAYLKVPLDQNQPMTTLLLSLHQKFPTGKISAHLKRVTLNATFHGTVDKSKKITGFSTILCYNQGKS